MNAQRQGARAGMWLFLLCAGFPARAAAAAPVEEKPSAYQPIFSLGSRWEDLEAAAAKIQAEEVPRLEVGIPYLSFKSTEGVSGPVERRLKHLPERISIALNLAEAARNHWTAPRKAAGETESGILSLPRGERIGTVVSPPFPDGLQSLLFWSCVARQQKLQLLADSPYFESFLDRPEVWGSLRHRAHGLVAGEHLPSREAPLPDGRLGFGDFVYALGRSQGVPVWWGGSALELPPGALHNLALYRAAQYAPETFLLPGRGLDAPGLAALRRDMAELAAGLDRAKSISHMAPLVANLVLCVRPSQAPFAEIIDPVMNTLLQNGYEVRVSFGELKPADLYYVLYSDGWKTSRGFMSELLRLLDHRKSRFYGKIILHPLEEMRKSGPWEEIRKFFGVSPHDRGWIAMPEVVRSMGLKVPWRGKSGKPFASGMTFIRVSGLKENGGHAFLAETMQGHTLALILSSGQHFLINGNLLDPQASYFLSQALSGTLLAPTKAYVTRTPSMTAALALSETDLKIKASSLLLADSQKLVVYSAEGRKIREESVPVKGAFETRLRAWELLVLTAEKKPF